MIPDGWVMVGLAWEIGSERMDRCCRLRVMEDRVEIPIITLKDGSSTTYISGFLASMSPSVFCATDISIFAHDTSSR